MADPGGSIDSIGGYCADFAPASDHRRPGRVRAVIPFPATGDETWTDDDQAQRYHGGLESGFFYVETINHVMGPVSRRLYEAYSAKGAKTRLTKQSNGANCLIQIESILWAMCVAWMDSFSGSFSEMNRNQTNKYSVWLDRT
jgi:hypothetical protein